MHTEYFLILLPFFLALALVMLCSIRACGVRRAALLQSAAPSAPRPSVVKCHIKTFEYRDGHSETRHSVCDGLHLDQLTDDAAQQFHPESKLTHVSGTVHQVRVK